jgi:hypothetical protein
MAAHVPAGIEYEPAACTRPAAAPPRLLGEISFRGLTLSATMDMLVEVAPLYEWRDEGGVVVLRPRQAWRDEKHFLNQRVENLVVHEGTLNTALARLQTMLGPWTFGEVRPASNSEQMTPTFDVSTGRVLAYEAMNAVVQAHGDARWIVRYCRPDARYEFATIELDTYDGKGIAGHAIFLTDTRGVRIDPCDPRLLR